MVCSLLRLLVCRKYFVIYGRDYEPAMAVCQCSIKKQADILQGIAGGPWLVFPIRACYNSNRKYTEAFRETGRY